MSNELGFNLGDERAAGFVGKRCGTLTESAEAGFVGSLRIALHGLGKQHGEIASLCVGCCAFRKSGIGRCDDAIQRIALLGGEVDFDGHGWCLVLADNGELPFGATGVFDGDVSTDGFSGQSAVSPELHHACTGRG